MVGEAEVRVGLVDASTDPVGPRVDDLCQVAHAGTCMRDSKSCNSSGVPLVVARQACCGCWSHLDFDDGGIPISRCRAVDTENSPGFCQHVR